MAELYINEHHKSLIFSMCHDMYHKALRNLTVLFSSNTCGDDIRQTEGRMSGCMEMAAQAVTGKGVPLGDVQQPLS